MANNISTRKSSQAYFPRWMVWCCLAGVVLIIYLLWRSHESHEKQEDEQNRPPSVRVVMPKLAPTQTDITLPGTIQAWQETPIYARTNGYLTHWYHDIGDEVMRGELLADIDTPDIDQQLMQTQGTLRQSEANLEIARITADRWIALVKENAVAKQDADEKVANYKALQATVEAARADTRRLMYLQSFKKITAPFSGVLTERTVDNGALITSGSAGSRELFKVAQIDVMRIYVGIPQTEARAIAPGIKAEVILGEFADRAFTGTVTRSAHEIDATARTLLTEVDVPNPDGALLPGMYSQVRFHFDAPEPALIIPASAIVIHAEEPKVVLVDENNKLRFASVVIGRDFGQQTEIVKGLKKDDRMVNNPNDTLVEGEEVQIEEKPPEKPKAAKEGDGDDKNKKDKSDDKSGKQGGGKKDSAEKASGDKNKKEGEAPKKNPNQDKTPATGKGEENIKSSNDALPQSYKQKPDKQSDGGKDKDGDKGGKGQ